MKSDTILNNFQVQLIQYKDDLEKSIKGKIIYEYNEQGEWDMLLETTEIENELCTSE